MHGRRYGIWDWCLVSRGLYHLGTSSLDTLGILQKSVRNESDSYYLSYLHR